MANKIVYSVEVNTAMLVVEASNRAQAVRIATRPLVGEISVMTGAEVLEHMRTGGTVMTLSDTDEQDEGEPEPETPPAAGTKAGDKA